jgi:hypothetical protein
LRQVFECPASEVARDFESGVTVLLEPSSLEDPAATWAEIAATDENLLSRVGTVRGRVALVTEPRPGVARGGVELVEGATLLKVAGSGSISAADLEAIMESLR